MTPRDHDRDDQAEDTGRFRRVLAESADDVVSQIDRRRTLTPRERELAGDVAAALVNVLPGLIGSKAPNLRLAQVETRLDAVEKRQHDDNGRMDRLEARVDANHTDAIAAIDAARADLGTPEERREERQVVRAFISAKRWALAKLLGSVAAVVAAIYGYLQVRDDARSAAAASAARTETRIEHLEKSNDRLLDIFLHPSPTRIP